MEDLVSIIMPTYNSSKFVGRSIEAIIQQSYPHWELLITDDSSTDDTIDILYKYSAKDKRIKVRRLKENSGGGVARNSSIEVARGRYLAFCDSDDIWHPEKLEKQIAFMRNNACDLSFTSYSLYDEHGIECGRVKALRKVSFRHEVMDNALGCSTVMYDMRSYGKIFFSPIRKRQDWAFMLRVMKKTRYALGMPEVLVKYTKRKNSISSNKLDLVKYNVAIYNKELGYPLWASYIIFATLFMPYFLYKRMKRWK